MAVLRLWGLPWWLTVLLLLAGIAIGNLVIPYDERRPALGPRDPEPVATQPAICRQQGEEGPLYEAFPLCP